MYGLFTGLEIGKRALMSSQLAINTTGHNMANVNTPGFSRQRVSVTTAYPAQTMWGKAGTGVEINGVEHIRDQFLTGQYRDENASLGSWEYREKNMMTIESFFNEPTENGLGHTLDEFWVSWENLAGADASNPALRTEVLSRAEVLTNRFHQLDRQLHDLRQNIDLEIRNQVLDLNEIGRQIADLNRQISLQELGSQKANDLRDRRDHLVDELSKFVDVSVMDKSNGTATVLIGSMAFVDGDDYLKLDTEITSNNGISTTNIVWEGTSMEVRFRDGEMAAMIAARDVDVLKYEGYLDSLAKTIVESVNQVHRTGYGLDDQTGRDFFDSRYIDAEHISISGDVLDQPNCIGAAAAAGTPGDGSIAQQIADTMKYSRIMDNNTATISEFYGGIVGRIGIATQEATNYKDNYGMLVQQIENQRQSVQGVSMDEEMINLVKFQNAYDAAARVITTMDQALETLIHNTGVVGR